MLHIFLCRIRGVDRKQFSLEVIWFCEAEDLKLNLCICFCDVEVQVMKDNALNVAYIVLVIGIILLAFTFISAYLYLINSQPITGSSDLINTFGDSLAPLIEASIRIMFLGIMGWISSILTARGVQLLTQLRRMAPNPEVQSMILETEKTIEPEQIKKTRKTRKS